MAEILKTKSNSTVVVRGATTKLQSRIEVCKIYDRRQSKMVFGFSNIGNILYALAR